MEEGFIDSADGDALVVDPDRIEGYRAIGLADGLIRGSQCAVGVNLALLNNRAKIRNYEQLHVRRINPSPLSFTSGKLNIEVIGGFQKL